MKVPAEVYSEDNILGLQDNNEVKDVYINPMQIESFGEVDDLVCITLKSGDSVYTTLELTDFIELMEEFYNK